MTPDQIQRLVDGGEILVSLFEGNNLDVKVVCNGYRIEYKRYLVSDTCVWGLDGQFLAEAEAE